VFFLGDPHDARYGTDMLSLIAGLVAGTMHVFTGPDHLAAVAPLAIRHPRKALRTGAAWGAGHALGVLILGGIGAAARSFINVESISAWAEFLVGGVLVGVGIWALLQSRDIRVHDHSHDHGDNGLHSHLHVHHHDQEDHAKHTHTAFGVGILHGAAGTGHLLGVLPSLALPPAQAVVYLLAYGVAAVVSMSGFGLRLGLLGRTGPKIVRGLVVASGVFAVALGLFWMISGWPLRAS
jgi:hypothetical protein